MHKVVTLSLVAVFFVAGALPVFAQEESETTTNTTTTETAPVTPSTPPVAPTAFVGDAKASWATKNADLLERIRMRLSGKGVNMEDKKMVGAMKRYVNANSSCIQKAVDDREVAVATAWATFASSITTALGERQKGLYEAWGEDTTERATALKAAWKKWKDASKSAGKELKEDRDGAWTTFRTTVKESCNVTLPVDEALARDSTGSIAL